MSDMARPEAAPPAGWMPALPERAASPIAGRKPALPGRAARRAAPTGAGESHALPGVPASPEQPERIAAARAATDCAKTFMAKRMSAGAKKSRRPRVRGSNASCQRKQTTVAFAASRTTICRHSLVVPADPAVWNSASRALPQFATHLPSPVSMVVAALPLRSV